MLTVELGQRFRPPGKFCRALTIPQARARRLPVEMKITGPNSLSSAAPAPRRSAGAGFALQSGSAAGARETSMTLGVSTLDSVDALIALQEIDGPLGRRRRAIGRAGRLLDELEGLKLALLEGEIDDAGLRRLSAVAREQREATSDPRLEAVLDQIEARAAVELAKRETALKAA